MAGRKKRRLIPGGITEEKIKERREKLNEELDIPSLAERLLEEVRNPKKEDTVKEEKKDPLPSYEEIILRRKMRIAPKVREAKTRLRKRSDKSAYDKLLNVLSLTPSTIAEAAHRSGMREPQVRTIMTTAYRFGALEVVEIKRGQRNQPMKVYRMTEAAIRQTALNEKREKEMLKKEDEEVAEGR